MRRSRSAHARNVHCVVHDALRRARRGAGAVQARRRVRRDRVPRVRGRSATCAPSRVSWPSRSPRAGGGASRGQPRVRGRTDAGVHAWGQVVSFDADRGLDLRRRARRPRTGCSGRRSSCARPSRPRPTSTPADSARGGATATRSSTGPAPDPFLARYAWWVPTPLDRARPPPRRRPVRRRARLRRVLPSRVRKGRASTRRVFESQLERPRRRRARATRSARTRSAGRWCARSSARSSTSGPASAGPAS